MEESSENITEKPKSILIMICRKLPWKQMIGPLRKDFENKRKCDDSEYLSLSCSIIPCRLKKDRFSWNERNTNYLSQWSDTTPKVVPYGEANTQSHHANCHRGFQTAYYFSMGLAKTLSGLHPSLRLSLCNPASSPCYLSQALPSNKHLYPYSQSVSRIH